MKIEEIINLDGMTVYAVTPTDKEVLVGDSFRILRNGAEIGCATTSGVLVGGKLLDRAQPGESCQLMLRGAKFEAGDLLQAEGK